MNKHSIKAHAVTSVINQYAMRALLKSLLHQVNLKIHFIYTPTYIVLYVLLFFSLPTT